MKITVAIDSFKGSLTSLEAGRAAEKGIKQSIPEAEVAVFPIADGGEGTTEALISGMGGSMRSVNVTSPTGENITASYGITGGTAVIEIASASGLVLVEKDKRDPMYTTTYGVGQMIRDAINSGIRDFLIGIGGSATNDCGVGMLSALGFKFLSAEGKEVGFGAKGVGEIRSIDMSDVLPELSECRFDIACDVKNPLCGEKGCSAVFAPQKGARCEDIPLMDGYISDFASLCKNYFPLSDPDLEGSGAAGGLGYAFRTFLGARLSSGIDLVLEKTGIEENIKNSDLVITGEGRLDQQTAMGKAPVGVAALAKKYNKPVIAFCGSIGDGAEEINRHGIDAFFSITPSPCTVEEAMKRENAQENMKKTVFQVINLLKTL